MQLNAAQRRLLAPCRPQIFRGIRGGLGIGRLFEPVYQLQADKDRFIPVMEPYWKTYPPVFLYYPKSAGKTKRVQSLIEFLILKNTK